jgi:hypothetical protein
LPTRKRRRNWRGFRRKRRPRPLQHDDQPYQYLKYIDLEISMSTIDRKALIEEERKKIFAKPIVTENPTFDQKQIEDFYTLFNLYADTRRQADVREIVATAQTLGYDKSHEFIFKKMVDMSD